MADDAENAFIVEDVEQVIKSALVNIFADVAYDAEKVSGWSNAVLEQTLKGLQAMGKNYKYVISTIIVQKNGAGLHTAAGLFWDGQKDGASWCERARGRARARAHAPRRARPLRPPSSQASARSPGRTPRFRSL